MLLFCELLPTIIVTDLNIQNARTGPVMGPQQFYLEISFHGFNMCTDLHMVELCESTNGNKSVDLITGRSMQYIYTLQGDPEQIIENLNNRSHTMEKL